MSGNSQKINEFVDWSALEAEKQRLIKEMGSTISELQKMGGKVSFGGGDTKTIPEATKVIGEYNKQYEKTIQLTGQLNNLKSQEGQVEEKLQQAQKEGIKTTKLQAASTNELTGAWERARAKGQLLDKHARDLAFSLYEMEKAGKKGTAEYQKLEQEFNKVSQEAFDFNAEIKKVDATINIHSKNVGNYDGAITSLRQEIKNMTQTLATMELQGKGNTKQYDDMVRKLGQLKDAVGDVQARSKFWADDARYVNTAVQAVQGLVGAYSVYVGVTEIVGEKNEELEKIMRKMMALMTVMQGLQQVANMLNKDSYVRVAANVAIEKVRAYWTGVQTAATGAGTVAQRAFNAAMKANPILIIISLLAAVGIAMWAHRKKVKEATEAMEENNRVSKLQRDELKKKAQAYRDAITSVDDYLKKLDEQGKTEKQRIIDSINLIRQQDLVLASAAGGMSVTSAKIKALTKRQAELKKEIDGTNTSSTSGLNLQKRLQEQYDGVTTELNGLNEKYGEHVRLQGDVVQIINEMADAQIAKVKATNSDTDATRKQTENLTVQKRGTSELTEEVKKQASAYMDLFAKIDWARRNNLQIPVTEEDIDLIKKTGKSIQDLEKDYEDLFGETKAAGESFSEWWGGLDMGGKADFIGEYVGKAIDAFGQYSDIVEGQNQQELEGFKTTQDEKLRVLNERLRLGYITEEQYTAQKSDLELDYEKKKQELEKESFKKKKAMMIAEATMTAASATIQALASKTTAEMVLKMAFIALTYGMQLAKIQAQTPGFAKGRKDGPGTFAKVGEQGWEFTGDGTNIFKTPNSTTLTYLKPHQWVMPHNESVQLEKVLGTPTVNQIVTKNPQQQDKELVKAIDRLAKKPTAIINMDKNGIRAALSDGNNTTNFVNNHILFKN